VTDRHGQSKAIGELSLELRLPASRPIPVAPTAVRDDQPSACRRVAFAPVADRACVVVVIEELSPVDAAALLLEAA
jgi:hypothetical protein